MIPRIIHQIWINSPLPERFRKYSETFRNVLPDWEYRLWGDAECDALMRTHFPEHIEVFRKLNTAAQKADLLRYMVICIHGGLYADVDCECKRPLDFIELKDELIVAPELFTTSARVMEIYRTDLPETYCMWAFLARPQHPVLAKLVAEIKNHVDVRFSDDPMLDVVKRTGPHLFTRVLKEHLATSAPVKIVPGSYFGCCDGRSQLRFALSFLFPALGRKLYIRHRFAGSWIDPEVKKAMFKRNLLPFSLEKKSATPTTKG